MAKSEALTTRVKSVLEDPSSRAVARVYAEAFLDAAAAVGEAVGSEETLEEFGSFLEDVLAKNPEFEAILRSGILGRDEKVEIINRVVAPFGSEVFTSFLRVLARHDRLDLLPLIFHESELMHEQRSGRKRVQVTSAVELSKEALEKIRSRLGEALEYEPILEPRVDPALIGGVVIRVDDTVYDSSLATRMKRLRERLRKRSLYEIQSGRDRFSHPEGD